MANKKFHKLGFQVGTAEYKEIQSHVSWGANEKVNELAMVFNAGQSTNCVSQALGLCQVPVGGCFMAKCESRYPALQPYHIRQGKLWKKYSPIAFAYTLLNIAINARTHKFEEFRYGESGDFASQEQLDWFSMVCAILRQNGIVTYGYTARTDLELWGLISASQVNLSNDKNRSLEYQVKGGANRFKAMKIFSGNADAICPCQSLKDAGIEHPCGHCNLCKVYTGLIEEKLT